MRICKAKPPYRLGVRACRAVDLGLTKPNNVVPEPAPVVNTPVAEPEVIQEVVNIPVEEPEVVQATEPVITESEVSVKTALVDAGFSATSVKNLEANEIFTVEDLLAYLETGATLEALTKIGAKSAKTIEEEISAWKASTSVHNSQE